MSLINPSAQRAEAAGQRAEAAAVAAERSAELATGAVESTKTAEDSANELVRKETDLDQRWELGVSCSRGIADFPGEKRTCKPFSAEDWKWVDSRVKQLNPNEK